MMRFEVHSHTMYSNLRLLDSINQPEKLIERAQQIGLAGISITDHECLSSHVLCNKIQDKIYKEGSSFKVALGNEIYLTDTRECGQKYYHFILIAKDAEGYEQLKKMSTRAWLQSYEERRMERVPLLKDELVEIIGSRKGHLIATSACMGSEVGQNILALLDARAIGDSEGESAAYINIERYIKFCMEVFGDNFYIECAPARSKDQIRVNQMLKSIAATYKLKMVIGSDAHMLTKEDRYVHEAFLNSKGGEREVASFYEYAYLQDDDDIRQNLSDVFKSAEIDAMYENSVGIYNKIEIFSLHQHPEIPSVAVKPYAKQELNIGYPILEQMLKSDDEYERAWSTECLSALKEKNIWDAAHLDELEEEADVKMTIGRKLNTNMFKYPLTLKHYVDMFWECGSTVGAGRGSACAALNHYLLGITQLDPLDWNLPFFRYMNRDRTEIGDIDLDLAPNKRPAIIRKIKAERAKNFYKGIDEHARKNLGCTLIATFSTATSKAAVKIACRGYRSEDYPDGIDNDIASYMTSLIPEERGFIWSLSDVVKGNPEKDRKPVKTFITEVSQYPGLLDIMTAVEGLVVARGSHASGVLLTDENPYQHSAFMRTPKGDVITQVDLHDLEYMGGVKYDFLLTKVQSRITETLYMLQQYGLIEKHLSLREMYDKYLHPSVLPLDKKQVWDAIENGSVLACFQFDSPVGAQAAKKIKPKTIQELTDANGLMRLSTEKGEELPLDKYVRYKNNISLWYAEMEKYGLTEQEQRVVSPYFKSSYGVPPSQEQLMTMLMDVNICGFSLAEANDARKIVGKKILAKVPALLEKVHSRAKSPALGNYVWDCGIRPQMSYAFSIIHALAYSFIGFQTAYLATNWNPIFWNTACLIVDSASLEDDDSDIDEDEENVKKDKSTNYSKTATAIGNIRKRGIKVSLVDINASEYTFKPDVENNEILFGMKGLNKVGNDVIEQIIAARPYTCLQDFLNRCKVNKSVTISLIKSGAFDRLDSWADKYGENKRKAIMVYYLIQTSEPKKRLTLQNFNGMLEKGLIPDEFEFEKTLFRFNKYLKTVAIGEWYNLSGEGSMDFYKLCDPDLINLEMIHGVPCINKKIWDKIYKTKMDTIRDWLKENQKELLETLNYTLFTAEWEKYATGTLSAWEMESLCFYYHNHELVDIDKHKYGIVNFSTLSYEPEVDYFFKRAGRDIPIFKLYKIAGTIISKNNTKASVAILTTDGVVNVKFTKEYYAMYNRQISETQTDGSKKVLEKGWFSRGTKIMVTGYRREDTFVAKTYKATSTHQLYRIMNVKGRNITLEHERVNLNG